MRKRIFTILPVLSCMAMAPAMANWQYDGTYIGDGWYMDDGSRFVVSVRGGASVGSAKTKNQTGALTVNYYYDMVSNTIIPETVCGNDCGDTGLYEFIGWGDLSTLPTSKKFEPFAFAGGASIGWTLPWRPQWRLEAGWDHIMKSDYNASPLFEGEMTLYDGTEATIFVPSGALTSSVETDIISAMAFYDFFDGLEKPMQTIIPYIGLGIGYADTTTVTQMSDPYGDLSADLDLRNFGELTTGTYDIISFYKSEHTNSNIAGLAAVGFSYGLDDGIYMDFGVRAAYIPKIKWTLTNKDNTRHRDWVGADNLLYINMMLGLRFEF